MAGLDLSVDVGSLLGINVSMLDAPGLEAIQEILQEVIYSWREVLQDVWPRDTGLSFSQWTSRVRGLVLDVRNPVEYAEWVHPAGEPEGASGDYLRDALSSFLDGARSSILRAVMDSESRMSSGLATAARQIGQPAQLGPGLAIAREAAFAALGGRQRQRQAFGALPPPRRERTVLATLGGVLVRFRQRVRSRDRSRGRF